MTREDLDELHALAASISDEQRGWRAHRRQKALTAARARLEQEQLAPGKRRRRHRKAAGAVVGVVAVISAVLIVTHLPGSPAPEPKRTSLTEHQLPKSERAGRAAGAQLVTQGRTPNVFACEGLYETVATTANELTAAWRAGYLAGCSHTVPSTVGAG